MEKDGNLILAEINLARYKEDFLGLDEIIRVSRLKEILPDSKLLIITDKRLPWGLHPFQGDPNMAVIRIGEANKYFREVSIDFLERGIKAYFQIYSI